MSGAELLKPQKPEDYLLIKSFRDKITNAIPNHLKADRVLQLAITLVKGSDKLLECTPISIMACVMESAQLGFELDPIIGHCYMVPFKKVATIIIGYRGFAHLMYQSGIVTEVSAEVVRPRDKFRVTLGTDRKLIHEAAPLPKKDDADMWVGAYAVVKFLTGGTAFEYMEAAKVIANRNRSRSWQAWLREQYTTPWMTDTEEMWRKTPIRRLGKRMPVSTTDKRDLLLRAVMLDEYSERPGLLKPTPEGFVPTGEIVEDFLPDQPPPIQPTTSLEDQLKDSIEYVNAGKKGGKPPKEPKKAPKEKAAAPGPGPVKAKIPPTVAYSGKPAIDDSVISVAQQTAIYNVALQAGWGVDEFQGMLKKDFKLGSIQHVRNSQYAEIMRIAKDGK